MTDYKQDIEDKVRNILSDSNLDSYLRGATKQADHSDLHEKYVTKLTHLINKAKKESQLNTAKNIRDTYNESTTLFPILLDGLIKELKQ